jgi:hypothetical protein
MSKPIPEFDTDLSSKASVRACERDNLMPESLGTAVYEAADRGEVTTEEARLLSARVMAHNTDPPFQMIAALSTPQHCKHATVMNQRRCLNR